MTSEPLVIDPDEPPKKSSRKGVPVVVVLDDVPPRAQSSGWGDMSWTKDR